MKIPAYKIPLLLKVVSLYLFISAPVLIAYQVSGPPPATRTMDSQAVQVEAPVPQSEDEVVAGRPVRLIIPRLDIDLTVEDGLYHEATGTWTLNSDSAHYALITAQPGNRPGHTLIYGHNTQRVLAATESIRPGDTMIIETDNGHKLTYTYTGDNVVDPDDTAFLQEAADKPVLTLLTCDGPWFEKRRLMSFTLTEVT